MLRHTPEGGGVTITIGLSQVPKLSVVLIFVLFAGFGSGSVAALLACVTVTMFLNVPHIVTGNLKEKIASAVSLGCKDLFALHEIGITGPAPGEQLIGSPVLEPAPVYVEPAGAVGVSVRLSGATDGTWPMFLMVTVHSTDCGPLTAHVLVTFKSGPVGACAITVNGARNKAAPKSDSSPLIELEFVCVFI